MEKVISNVVFMDSKGDVSYAVMYVGVMTRRNIYAKLNSFTGSDDTPLFVKIARNETKDTTAGWCCPSWKGKFRDIYVPEDLGLKDPRILTECEFSEEVLTAILEVVKEVKETV